MSHGRPENTSRVADLRVVPIFRCVLVVVGFTCQPSRESSFKGVGIKKSAYLFGLKRNTGPDLHPCSISEVVLKVRLLCTRVFVDRNGLWPCLLKDAVGLWMLGSLLRATPSNQRRVAFSCGKEGVIRVSSFLFVDDVVLVTFLTYELQCSVDGCLNPT